MTTVIIADEERAVLWSAIARDAIGDKEISIESPRDFDSDKAAIALLDRRPSFILLPLTLPRFGSLRIAEWTHRRYSETRVILISGTNCEHQKLRRLFDSVFGPSALTTRSLQEALNRPIHRIEDGAKIDAAISAILDSASCFRVYARDHVFPLHPTVHDYHGNQDDIITTGNYASIIIEISYLRKALESSGKAETSLVEALRAIENEAKPQFMTTDGPTVGSEATPSRMRKVAKKTLEISEKLGIGVATAALKAWLGL